MPPLRLQTLGTISLSGPLPIGTVVLDEPRLIALVVMLAVAGDAGVTDEELLLRLTPDETAERGRTELARLVAVARLRLGGEQAIVRRSDAWAFVPGLLTMDVRVLPSDGLVECAEFLAGFRLPGSPEFREWLAATRRRVEPRGAGAPVLALADAAPVPRRRTFSRRLVAVALLGLVVSAGAFLTFARSAQGLSAGDALLVADVRNETGDSLFDVGLERAATVAMQQSRRIQLYPRSRLANAYRRMQIANPDTALTFDLAQEVAQRDHIRFVLGIHITRAGDGYRVTGQLADVSASTRVTETSAIARTRDDAIEALDQVLLATRRQMGESRRDVSSSSEPLPAVTTRSLEALRAFGEGSTAWARGDYTMARELWLRAVDIDTGFAMAYGALGASHYYNHDRFEGERYYGEALKRAGRMSDRERLQMMASLQQYRGHLDSAVAASEALATRYPGSSTWYSHATMLMNARRDSQAIAAFKTALRYDSAHVSSYINLATLTRRRERAKEALAYYERAGRLDSTVLYRNNINHEYGGTLVLLGRFADADSAFRRMSVGSRIADRALGFRSRGYLALWLGHPDEAAEQFQLATAAAVQLQSPLGEARSRMLLASAHRAAGREREAAAEVARLMPLLRAPVMEPFALALVGTSLVRAGRVADADSVLTVLRSRVNRANGTDTASEAYVAGLIALARRQPERALRHAQRATPLPQPNLALILLAESHRQLGHADSARTAVTKLLDAAPFGSESQEDWLRAPLVLGDILASQGDTAGALAAYRRLIDQWRSAPAGLPDLVAARSKIAALRGVEEDPRR